MRYSKIFFYIGIVVFIASCGAKRKIITKTNTPITTKKSTILEKYSTILKTTVSNERLYSFVDKWIGVPYKYGGKDQLGIDCSNFTCQLLRQVYDLPSSFYFPSSSLINQTIPIEGPDLNEGDLIFFSISKNNKISHVGVYLTQQKFIHASTSKGVMISSLDEGYYKSRIYKFGRMK